MAQSVEDTTNPDFSELAKILDAAAIGMRKMAEALISVGEARKRLNLAQPSTFADAIKDEQSKHIPTHDERVTFVPLRSVEYHNPDTRTHVMYDIDEHGRTMCNEYAMKHILEQAGYMPTSRPR